MKGKRRNWCIHYRGLQYGYKCDAGVNMLDFNNGSEHALIRALPCFGEGSACRFRKTLTPEEVATLEDAIRAEIDRMVLIREAIVTACPTYGSGSIVCPCCGGTVNYSIAQVNKNVWARCSTEGCASWME